MDGTPLGYQLGVDLGTTYTAAATARDGRVEIVSLGNRAAQVPSVIFLRSDETILVGEAAERRGRSEPGRVAREFKRRVGDPTPILVGGTPYSAEALMAKLLAWVVDKVSELEGGPPDAVAVTHPANWGMYKKDLLYQAVRLANLEDVTFCTEPEAAALHYASNERIEPGSVVAVYDLGGGTFDATVLAKTDAGFDVLGTPEGIERLGGIDFDEAVFQHVNAAIDRTLDALDPADAQAVAAVARLRQETVAAKEALSADTDTTVPVLLPHLQTDVRLTRPEFETMIRLRLTDTIEAMRRALKSAGVPADAVTKVLLVGGSSRIPLVAQLVSSELGRPVALDAHPKHAVALGAALAAVAATGQSVTEVLTVAPPPEPEPAPPTMAPPAAAPPDAAAPVWEAAPPRPAAAPPSAQPPPAQPPPAPRAPEPVAAHPPAPQPALDLTEPVVAVARTGAGAGDRRRGGATRVAAVIGLAVVVVAAAVGTYLVLFRGGETAVSSTAPAATPGDDADPGTTTAAPATPSAEITSVARSGDDLTIAFTTEGFTPEIDGGPESRHMHFFFNTTKPANAGVNGNPPGTWDLYDGPSPYEATAQKIGGRNGDKGATAVCVVVATREHAVADPDSGNCLPLP